MLSLIQHFVADFLWKVSHKMLNSGIILKTFTHVNNCITGGTQHERNNLIAPAPMPGSPIVLVTKLIQRDYKNPS